MRINKINTSIPQKSNGRNINKQIPFKGTPIGTGLDSFSLFVADLIENGGLAVSFTLQDMLGTNLPRPIMGLMRNKKESGENNTKFALKELVREMMTGPSMFIIPAFMLKAGKKIFGKTIEVPMKFIKSFGEIHAAAPLDKNGQAIGQQEFFKNTFTEIIKNAKSESEASAATVDTAGKFAEKLAGGINKNAAVKQQQRGMNIFQKVQNKFSGNANKANNPLKQTISELSDEFVSISKKHAKDAAHTDFTRAAVSPGASDSFKNTVNYMISYADDIVEKSKTQDTGHIKEFINKLANKKVIGRFASNILMYAAVMTFLQVIPRLYNKAEGEENAGLKGLMKEETLNDKSLEDISNKKSDTAQNHDKSKISFGSSAQVVNKLTGSGIAGKIANGLEFQGYNVSFPMLLGVMGFGIILPRTLQAKDKYDREEILRRDITTCATMCFAEKELRKGFSKLNEKNSGFVLAAKDEAYKNKSIPKKIIDYLRPVKGVQVLSTDQIVSKYSNIDNYKEGMKGFCDFIDEQGGNLAKVFSCTEESKEIVQELLKKEGKDIASADNAVIRETLCKAENSAGVEELTKLFKDKNNAWVKKAKTLNARFTALSVLVLVPAFLGFFLPFINEKSTKKRINKENEVKEQVKVNMLNQTYYFNKDKKENNIFSDMTNYTK